MKAKILVRVEPGVKLITLRAIGVESNDLNDYISVTSQEDVTVDGQLERTFTIGVEAHNPATTIMWNVDNNEQVEVQMPTVNEMVTTSPITYHLATNKNRLNDGDTNSTYVQILGITYH